MKTYEAPKMELIEFELKDIISASDEEPDNPPSTNSGSTCSPINLPCHSQEGNQPAC
jgi:hypothetical protein